MALTMKRLLVCLLLSCQIAMGCLRMKVTACLPVYACTRPIKAKVEVCAGANPEEGCSEPVTCPDVMCPGQLWAGKVGQEQQATSVTCTASTKMWNIMYEDGSMEQNLPIISLACINKK